MVPAARRVVVGKGRALISANLFGGISALEIDAFEMIRLDLSLFGSSFQLIL